MRFEVCNASKILSKECKITFKFLENIVTKDDLRKFLEHRYQAFE